MSEKLLEKLVQDADRVADVGVRLGRIKSVEFLAALSAARQALNNHSVSPQVIADLQKWLNLVVNDISPITLYDLRAGWEPFVPRKKSGLSLFAHWVGIYTFGFFGFLLLFSTAYITQLYDRSSSFYAMTVELQEKRGTEQAVRLFGLLKKNHKDVVESFNDGNKDFLYETFNKALFDVGIMNIKYMAYKPAAYNLLCELDLYGRLKDFILSSFTWYNSKPNAACIKENDNPLIKIWSQNYISERKISPNFSPSLINLSTNVLYNILYNTVNYLSLKNTDIISLINIHFHEIRNFASNINIDFDPFTPVDYSYEINQLRESMSTLGSWILPALYGMLGAVIFHVRRLLDPSVPNPTWLRFAYRIGLGGFAGIILVWFWTQSPSKLSQPAFATITSFGLAFLVGFSTDIFFQALDRLVNYLSQAVGTTKT